MQTNQINNTDQFVFCKLDWYSMIFQNNSLRQVYEFIGLNPDDFSEELIKNIIIQQLGMNDRAVLSYNGIRVDISVDSYVRFKDQNFVSFFDSHFDKIRLDISGSGLDFLRDRGFDVDNELRSLERLLPDSHTSRVDFAFDFVNYRPDENGKYLDITGIMVDYITKNVGTNGYGTFNRAGLVHRGSGLVCDVKLNNQRTCYFGSPQSDKMLRVYDKKLQYFDCKTGVYIKDNPYDNPVSWHRIELQTRNKLSNELCFAKSESGLLGILRWIYDTYNFNDMQSPYWKREPFWLWHDIYDWDTINSVAKYCISRNYSEPKINKITDYFRKVELRHFLMVASRFNSDELIGMLQEYLASMQGWKFSADPIKKQKELISFNCLLNECEFTPEYFSTHNSILTYNYTTQSYTVNRNYFYSDSIPLHQFISIFPDKQRYYLYDTDNKLLTHGYREYLTDYYDNQILSVYNDNESLHLTIQI